MRFRTTAIPISTALASRKIRWKAIRSFANPAWAAFASAMSLGSGSCQARTRFDKRRRCISVTVPTRPVVVANVQNVAQRTFYQRGAYWEDTGVKENQQFVQIKQFSDAHFKLMKAYPKLTQYSTLGNVRLTLENSQAVEIGPEGKDKLTDEEVASLLKGIGG